VGIWVMASLVAFMTTPSPTGFGLFTLTGASGFDAFLVAFALQLAASKWLKKEPLQELQPMNQRRNIQ
ncbi:MAG TPA: hypothetical protein VIG80_09680, partial [Bacillaceae bacterium]